MRRKRLLWQIFPSYLLITLLSLAAITWYASSRLRTFYLEQTRLDLRARAELFKRCFANMLSEANSEAHEALCRDIGKATGMRITVIDLAGRVLVDSHEQPELMENHAHRPEVAAAMEGRSGMSVRFSDTLRSSMMYVTLPVNLDGEPAGVIRTAVSLASLESTLAELRSNIMTGGMLIALLVAIISFLLARKLTRPLEDIRRGAERFAHGDLEFRLPSQPHEETGALAEAMNAMAAKLEDRIATVMNERNESDAVLSSMIEGVLAVNLDETLIRINRVAIRMLGLEPLAAAAGRAIFEVVRNTGLQRFVEQALACEEPVEGEFVLQGETERYVQAHGSALRDGQGHRIGALIVLNDMTRLRKLETVRRDFVANVSHELKTPITSIKGFVETLLDGALDNREDAVRFLNIILKHADRLNSIIEDLLSLSRIEQEAENKEVDMAPASVNDMLNQVAQLCQAKAQAKRVLLQMRCPETLQIQVNRRLIEQALVNLVDNAIKYSDAGKTVQIEARAAGREVTIAVRDAGCGIDREHLSRLFERFYRVDKARSRDQGGTGLGLAIVKHIAQAHSGRVQVESAPGQGSTFTLFLPQH